MDIALGELAVQDHQLGRVAAGQGQHRVGLARQRDTVAAQLEQAAQHASAGRVGVGKDDMRAALPLCWRWRWRRSAGRRGGLIAAAPGYALAQASLRAGRLTGVLVGFLMCVAHDTPLPYSSLR